MVRADGKFPMTPVHQHVRIGAYAIIGGGMRVTQDIVPFAMAAGMPVRIYGLNREGLKRHSFSADQQRNLKAAYRILFWSGLTLTEALARLKAEMSLHPRVAELIRFVEGSHRGLAPGLRVGTGDSGSDSELVGEGG